jgi:hypothetical protein
MHSTSDPVCHCVDGRSPVCPAARYERDAAETRAAVLARIERDRITRRLAEHVGGGAVRRDELKGGVIA